jgi:site-specific DNA-methyltransferase (adenine-specific)
MNEAYNCDCLEYMRSLPDNAFDLCIADPPYGDAGATEEKREWGAHFVGRGRSKRYAEILDGDDCSQSVQVEREKADGGADPDGRDLGGEVRKKIIAWDVAPGEEYFAELFRVSRNQIIWGGNYFNLPPTRCFLVWRKLSISESFSMAMAEYAWTSFNSNAKVFEAAPQGKVGDPRFHPTQKPVDLYKWILKLYAKPGDKIFDPYLGSGSSRIAAWDMGFDFVGCEIDKTYFELMEKRFKEHTAQTRMF